MIEYAKINFKVNKLNLKKIYQKDFLDVDIDNKFDFIVSHPPFYNSKNVTQSSNPEINMLIISVLP